MPRTIDAAPFVGAQPLAEFLNRRAAERGDRMAPCETLPPAQLAALAAAMTRSAYRAEIRQRLEQRAKARQEFSWLDD